MSALPPHAEVRAAAAASSSKSKRRRDTPRGPRDEFVRPIIDPFGVGLRLGPDPRGAEDDLDDELEANRAESAAAGAFLATALGVPVSTTHTITGAIVGVGSVQRASAVRWGVAGNIVWAWILTIPASAFVAALAYALSMALF